MIEKVFEKCLWFIYCRSVIEILSMAFVLTFILLLIMIIMERKSNYHVYKNNFFSILWLSYKSAFFG